MRSADGRLSVLLHQTCCSLGAATVTGAATAAELPLQVVVMVVRGLGHGHERVEQFLVVEVITKELVVQPHGPASSSSENLRKQRAVALVEAAQRPEQSSKTQSVNTSAGHEMIERPPVMRNVSRTSALPWVDEYLVAAM
jgi:hypothetical protein